MRFPVLLPLLAFTLAGLVPSRAVEPRQPREFIPPPFDAYFQHRVQELSKADWSKDITAENWPGRQAQMRKQLQGMLGLDPWPERGELKPVITGKVEGDGYVVENLQFQSSPGLYVTGNLYRPKEVTSPLPTILYVCGHSRVVEDGVSLGNKTGYQHHGAWFARHGYVCLVIDTIQLGEIQGEHWGTYARGRWWWPGRGYTPAGVEAWNSIRALDYLETRPEVDRTRFGITGRSGGGAYSWSVAALDERIKVAAPTAGITTLKNHVLDGAVEGHCDCMFHVNTQRWDFDRVAALVAPRPLLICNTDKDEIFPLDGVMEIYNRTRALYRQLGKEDNIGLQIAEGPHKDTQPLNTGAFHWFERFLKGADRMTATDEPAVKRHKAAELRVFSTLPTDEKVTTVDQWFIPEAKTPSIPAGAAEWKATRDRLLGQLKGESFRAWPECKAPSVKKLTSDTSDGLELTSWEFSSEEPFRFQLWLMHRAGLKPEELELMVLNVMDDEGWQEFRGVAAAGFPDRFAGATKDFEGFGQEKRMLKDSKWAMAYFAPRGAGPTSFAGQTEIKRTHLLRRFMLLGETLESGQVYDISDTAAALRAVPGLANVPLWMQAQKQMAVNVAFASLFTPNVTRLDLHNPPTTQADGPIYLNALRTITVPEAFALAADQATVAIYSDKPEAWSYPQAVAASLGWKNERVQVRKPVNSGSK